MTSIVERKLQELSNFQDKWGEELLSELGMKKGHTLSLSFDPNVQLQVNLDLAPLEAGFYVSRQGIPGVVLEVLYQDAANGVVVVELGQSITGPKHTQVISRHLFDLLFVEMPSAGTVTLR